MSTERLQQTSRDLDPNVLQRRASNPQSSVWVSASAGTGKTKVLTDRVLRLLLPQESAKGQWSPGCAPHKILGLTFTKAAASEMALRINETLSKWTILSDEKLTEKLKQLLGYAPSTQQIAASRKLFADVIDTPGRLKIMTIHAFCQSVLSRFPLEAGLTVGFEVADDRKTQEFLKTAKTQSFKTILSDKTNPLYAALSNLSRTINETQLDQLITAMASERGQLEDILKKSFGIDGLYTNLCTELDITPGQSPQDIIAQACEDKSFKCADLKSCADSMADSTKTDQKNAALIHDFISKTEKERIDNFETYKSAFLKKDGEIKTKLIGKKITDADPSRGDKMLEEAHRLQAITDKIKAATIAALTRDLIALGNSILENYAHIKTQHNMLDYEDLIIKTRNLLKTRGNWVHYKLDSGIDHILIDEAQDTNPEQWKIIESLAEEFFAPHSAPEENNQSRTIFTVGDEKQSIYSFQRASPEEFERMHGYFADKITNAKANWNKVDLNISFRSTKSVLASVDAVFRDPQARKGLGIGEINHSAFRRGQAGLVELWPLFENDEIQAKEDGWTMPTQIIDQKSGASKCACKIADQIKHWLETKEQLPSYNRAIEPRDILILVRTRNAFIGQLTRALKSHNIPVGGADRIILNDQIAVQDILAAADFALLPSDDLTLACLLKSPLIGMDEETLFTLAHDRGEQSLWQSVQDNATPDITNYLKSLIADARHETPYAFIAKILQTPCPADDQGGMRAFHKRLGADAHDSLDELLNSALNFEHEHTPSLQSFLHWQHGSASEMKRDTDTSENHIRIMTVHGSKGLQAPIVFLPDTVGVTGFSSNQAGNRLLWPTQTNQSQPIWAPQKDSEPEHYKLAKEKTLQRLDEEYRRLLYVAMTRAEDRLYITGYKGKRDIAENCWYNLCKNGLKSHEACEEKDGESLRLSNPQTKEADREQSSITEQITQTKIPDWFTKPAPGEPDPPAPLIPSRPAETEPAALSPLSASDQYRFRRGNVTHALLQFIPDIAKESRAQTIQEYLQKHADDLPESVQLNIKEEIIAILNNPQFGKLFGENSRAEVPITGLLKDGRLISGQIDRLLITKHEILIIDFKTNRPPPKDPKDVPQIYKNQLKAYADVLTEIYPERTIKTALLWTDGPNLMPIDA